MARLIIAASALVWAGLALGGNLIVAPAKFQVADLTLSVALQVGRAQFTWIGYAEWVFLCLGIAAVLFLRTKRAAVFLVPVIIFIAQQFWIMPLLNARSDIIIAGNMPPESNLHLVFIILELFKCLTLALIGLTILARQTRA